MLTFRTLKYKGGTAHFGYINVNESTPWYDGNMKTVFKISNWQYLTTKFLNGKITKTGFERIDQLLPL